MEGNAMGCSWVLHHVQNPTLTSTGCFILGSLDIHDAEIGHEYLVSAGSSLSVRAIAIYKFEPHFIILHLKSTSHHHNIFPGDPCQYSYHHHHHQQLFMSLCKVEIIRHKCCEAQVITDQSDSTLLGYVSCLLTCQQCRTFHSYSLLGMDDI
jgi:hypothetical protein